MRSAKRRRNLTDRLSLSNVGAAMTAAYIAAFVLCFSSTAWAAYPGTPPEVPDARAWTWLAIAIVFAFGLYALRCWRPIIYGLVELIAAVFIIYFSIAPAKQPVATYCNGKVLLGFGCDFQSYLIILAGIYIFVRGLDNMQARRLLCFVQAWRSNRRDGLPDSGLRPAAEPIAKTGDFNGPATPMAQ
jgi:hypothetical protein